MDSKSLVLVKSFLNQIIEVTVNRQLGSLHPKWNFKYPVNYGFIKNVLGPDGEELDAYILKVDKPLEKFMGKVVAIIHRLNDDDDKLIIIPENESVTNEEIEKLTFFQEQFFKHEIIRK